MRTPQQLLNLCDCESCPINKAGRRNPVMGDGPDKADLVIVGDSPGVNEHVRGIPLSGQSGQLLNATLQRVGLSREEVYVTNTVLCRPDPYSAEPSQQAVACCRPRLMAEIEDRDAKIIVPMGNSGTQALLNTKAKISTVQGVLQYDDSLGRWILPTYHPTYCLRSPGFYEDFHGDFERAADLVLGNVDFPQKVMSSTYTHYTVANASRAKETLSQIAQGVYGNVLACDVETDNTDTTSQLLTIQFGNVDEAWVFDAEIFFEETCAVAPIMVDQLIDVLTNPNMEFIFHNQSFDLQVIYHWFDVHHSEMNVVDTMCLALGLTERGSAVGLKALARKWFNAPFYEEELDKYLPSRDTPFSNVPRPVLAKYAAADTIYTARLRPLLDQLTEVAGTKEMCYTLLMSAQKAFADMEYVGVAIDTKVVRELKAEWVPKIRQMLRDIQAYAKAQGWPYDGFNPASPPQMRTLLYDIMKMTPPPIPKDKQKKAAEKGKTANASTGKDFREKYPDHPFSKMLGEYATAKKMMSTYVDGITDDIRRVTGRVHPQFMLFGTVTGRLAIKDPPIQTIPREETSGKVGNMRRLFIAKPLPTDEERDVVFVGADYKQLELRIAWLLTHDPNMGSAILEGDFHRITASRIWKKPIETVTSVERHDTKYVTFGIMYGRGAYSLYMGQLGEHGYSLSQSEHFLAAWYSQFPVFKMWFDEQRELALSTGVLRTPFNRVRRFPLITAENKNHLLNQAVNFPVQSTATDVTLSAMIRLNDRLRREKLGRVLFTVHDSIESEVYASRKFEAMQVIYDEMITIPEILQTKLPPGFELEVDVEYGPSWGESEIFHPERVR